MHHLVHELWSPVSGGIAVLMSPRDRPLHRLGRSLLLLLALVLPFEARLFRLGFLQITTVELVLYAMLASWLAGILDDLRTAKARKLAATFAADPLARAVALFVAVLFISAAAAPSDRAAAFKFALRSLSGILVFFATRSLLRPADVRRVCLALVAGALLSAITAIVDLHVPGSSILWRHFREGSFTTLGLIRASGVFGYPTIGAMYWEAAAPLLVVLPFLSVDAPARDRATRRLVCVVLGSALLVTAILASATRSGLAGMALACVALLGLSWRTRSDVRRAASAALAVTLAVGLSVSAFESMLAQRLLFWRDGSWFSVEYQIGATPPSIHPREQFTVPVSLRNTGVLTWTRTPPSFTRLSYHWQRVGGAPATLADFEGLRTELPEDVPPGGMINLLGLVRGPRVPGTYRLSWDLVQEGVCWFSERGNPMAGKAIVEVQSGDTETSASMGYRPAPTMSTPPPTRRALWRAAVVLWREHPLLGIGPDNFRRRYEAVLGTAPTGQPYTDTRIHANSLYFETLADLGLAGIAALAWIGLALVRALGLHWRTGCVAGLGSAIAAGTFFVHGTSDYFFEFTPLLGLFWLLLGLTAVSEADLSERSAPHAAGSVTRDPGISHSSRRAFSRGTL
jgi:hypothetical protein